MGLTTKGEVDAPKDPTKAAWFNLGSRPGEEGSAVIVGHFGWKNGLPSIFDNLSKLVKGDRLYVTDKNGAVLTFVVKDTRIYSQYDDALEVFGSVDGKAHLNLITCSGVWNKVKKSYPDRLVIFSEKETK